MKEAEELFKNAREQKEKDYQTALETLRKTINNAHAAVKEFRPHLTAVMPSMLWGTYSCRETPM